MAPRSFHRRIQYFWITILCISTLALVSAVANWATYQYDYLGRSRVIQRHSLARLEVDKVFGRDQECRLVHHAQDKCAFVKGNCPDEEVGLFSYLSLYYCHLDKAKPVAFVILTVWLALLFTTIGIAASDFFCINLSTIASILGMSESMAGVTFLAFGNGSPDVFSTFAAMSSHSGSLAVGELIGAAGFITAVVAGSMALVREFKVGKKTFVRDIGFFIVAASFSMVFLADGTLHLWECCAMVGFYIFYVITVVAWHWYLGRRRRRREREAVARGHYLAEANQELEVTEEDGDGEEVSIGERPYRNLENFSALESSASLLVRSPAVDDVDSDVARGKQLAAEMASSMRVTRPRGSRTNTITPIRPSLVGALEFRSVLSSLQRSRDSSSRLMLLRRYSDDPTAHESSRPDTSGIVSYNTTPLIVSEIDSDYIQAGNATGRTKTVSLSDAEGNKLSNPADPNVGHIPDIGIVAATQGYPHEVGPPAPASSADHVIKSPTISLSPPTPTDVLRSVSSPPSLEPRRYDSNLAPPGVRFPGAHDLYGTFINNSDRTSVTESSQPLRLKTPPAPMKKGHAHSRPDSSQSPLLPFPTYTDSPVLMSGFSPGAPDPIIDDPIIEVPHRVISDPILRPSSSGPSSDLHQKERPIRWWPYSFLPDPYVLLATLFPTLCHWKEKSIWDKFVSVVSAPSIFLLAITLPVVESESQDEATPVEHNSNHSTTLGANSAPALVSESPSLVSAVTSEWIQYRRRAESYESPHSPPIRGRANHSSAEVAVAAEEHCHHPHMFPILSKHNSHEHVSKAASGLPVSQRDWSRWLITVQIFTAPLFIVLIVWANHVEEHPSVPFFWILLSLLTSLLTSIILISTTTPFKPPRYRFLFCFLGFVVSIAWISTIANEVVGVLKAFGVILGISDAILGLTIFAVGNSLGDLVADITVARLGYPVMALSACFGGPMLNILLGIGISGLYMTVRQANSKHAHHPHREIRYRPYQIEVSGTLMVSGVTLLVTLVGLLVAVPMNGWVMSRRIGWGLIALWSISTVINLGVEVSGVWDETVALRS